MTDVEENVDDKAQSSQIEELADHKNVLIFMSAALIIGFALFAVLGYVMVRKPAQYDSEVQQRPYVSRYTLPSPTSGPQDVVTELDSIVIDDLDSSFIQVDKNLDTL
ncbi:hypothetical protein A3I56_00240 [Candidatus Roizmanbacteria bacterium RIFCSPLOWO2_02_FULL_43_10]|uniref:Uncharacterized protein n=1 Tax=Candidatus Roizmanbacteria bacterium RIFCSPLOWO2_02_FULL_43_10 TaxID=1802078 RepID=A0A1F7JU73_9BACT|nr:MAG: hypothetical protein A3I56_00240 [Candidatus Roizmanbacteria bacterium RIFCSPLOWO2_02_FULL_43_10]